MAQDSTPRSFSPFRLDVENQCLFRNETRILLPPKVFAVLEYLVRHAGRLVPQEELLEAVWPETYVQPEVLRKYILEIRRILDDQAKEPRFVETIPRRGYRFIAAVGEKARESPADDPGEELVGRESAFAELNARFQEARLGQRRVVFITGETGIGKTRLVDAFARSKSNDASVRIVRGQCVEGFGGKEAYYPVLEAVGALLRDREGEQFVQILANQAPTWLIQFPSSIQPGQKERLQHELLGATRERMVRELCDAIETLTHDQILVLILEDLQWVDNPTLDLISAVARRRGPAKLLLLATYRTVDVILSRTPLISLKRDLLVHRLCMEVGLNRLTEGDISTYLSVKFPQGGLPELLSPLIHRLSEGNPLFMTAILERLVQSGLIRREADGWEFAVPAQELDLDIPETLHQMLETQLDQLSDPERQLLRAASVAGGRFQTWMPAALLDGDAERVEELCDALAGRQQFLTRVSSADGSPYTEYEFRHILYREVLYRQLSPSQSRRLHLRLAGRMETMVQSGAATLTAGLAFHFEQGRDYEKAIRYLMATAANAIKRYAHGESIQVLNHALDLLDRVPAQRDRELELSILERISDSLYALGEMQQSAEIDYKAASLAAQAGNRTAQVHALTRVARSLAFLDPVRCNEVCDKAVAVSQGLDDPLLQTRAEMLASSWHIVTNGWRSDEGLTCAAARERLRELSHDLPAYYEILYAHVQCIQGDYFEAAETARAAVVKAVEDDSLVVYLSAHSSMAHALLHMGEWDELIKVLSTAQEVADKNGNAPWRELFQAFQAWFQFQACNFDGSIALASELLRRNTEATAGQAQTIALVARAYSQIECGCCEAAMEALTAVCERPEEPRFFFDWYWRIMARLGLATALEMTGELEEAARVADLCLESTLATSDPNLKALAWELSARVNKYEPAKAWHRMGQAFQALANHDLPIAEWRVDRTASRLCASFGKIAEAEQHRERAASILRKIASSCPSDAPEKRALEVMSQSQRAARA